MTLQFTRNMTLQFVHAVLHSIPFFLHEQLAEEHVIHMHFSPLRIECDAGGKCVVAGYNWDLLTASGVRQLFFDVRHVGFSNTYFNIEIDSEIEVAVARPWMCRRFITQPLHSKNKQIWKRRQWNTPHFLKPLDSFQLLHSIVDFLLSI